MEIVVNDTNIFIDLHSIGLLEQFFELPITVHTVDFIITELTDSEQHKAISKYIENGKLNVQSLDATEMLEVIELQNKAGGNVSIPDCAVWNYAKKNNYTLLTGDGQLRKKAIESNVTVKGVIYVFDYMVECCIITPKCAATKLQELITHNSRLPKTLIQERIEKWSE